ncbi:cyclic nucleotide-binding domain-containing protein [Roseibium denhamense]|uniref:Voltage-gated potassium channel n=1 Tax=Roseibium denhamense TaxID=76305 RepID=A0ABY1N7J0_9HYPH|nr:cyclic nucleotide-gated ion channel [Roseibium denhamense]MTI05983.1 cyclic nucleotide-binding domain-containing protein [Roseibium denhamense]SMP02517.1 voltage-gated potassium channel [Roseibium denhamense]
MQSHEFKRALFEVLEDTGKRRLAARSLRQFLIFLIIANVAFAVLETVPEVRDTFGPHLKFLQLGSGLIFLVEYVLRLYVADLHPPMRRYGPVGARLRYALHPDAIVDLIGALPLVLVLILPTQAVTMVVILRLLRFLKLARYSPALRSLISAVAAERRALLGSSMIIFGVILMAATLMYVIEHDDQPEKFKSILHGVYWAITTVTTVGYGDVVPISNLGKMVGAVVMLMGYGLIALPVGIIASAFAREIHSRDFVVTWSMVARVPLFEDLKAAEIAEVAKLLQAQSIRKGGTIAQEGDVADRMYFIADGEVEIKLARDSIYLGEGSFFGELALINQTRRSASVIAYRDCQLLVLEADALQNLMDRDATLATKIMEEARERVKAGKRILGELAEEELEQAGVYASAEDVETQPELFDPSASRKV